MEDLEKQLASLRLDDEPPRSQSGPRVVIAVLVFMVAASTILWWGQGAFAATEVETTTPRVERSGGAPSGTPLLTASGYVVARRKAVVSAKIQGRLADLRVEEGARARGRGDRSPRERSPTGAEVARLGHFSRAISSKMVVALPDGRNVVDVRVVGRMRLMVLEQGKSPEPLLKSQEESTAPMTALAGNRIAFAVGPEPRETIAVAGTVSGRVSGRISPGKGVIQTLAASADGETLFFTAGGSVWSVATAGGEPRRTGSGQWVMAHPSGALIVARNEASQVRLF